MDETLPTERFLRDTLKANAALNTLIAATGSDAKIYRDFAPQGSVLPFVIYNMSDSEDTTLLFTGASRGLTHLEWRVRGIVEGRFLEKSGQIATEIDRALQNAGPTDISLFGETIRVNGCYRSQPLNYTEEESGVMRVHRGGVYRLQVYKM